MHLQPATLEAVRHLLQVVRLLIFLGFLGLAVRLRFSKGMHRRRAVNHLILYILFVQGCLILSQNEAWPFTMYPMMASDATGRAAPHQTLSFREVDDEGREWMVDPDAWAPLYPQSIMGWFAVADQGATSAERAVVLRFLLSRAEEARQNRVRGVRFLGNRALLGPLAAPDTNLYAPAPQPDRPLRALRVYRIAWSIVEFAQTQHVLSRTLLYEVRR